MICCRNPTRRIIPVVALLVPMMLAASCAPSTSTRRPSPVRIALDAPAFEDFESPKALWTVEEADDHADLSRIKHNGSWWLETAFTAGPRKKIHLRREEPLDLSDVTHLTMDVDSVATGMSIAVGLKSDPGGHYAETEAVPLTPGSLTVNLRDGRLKVPARGSDFNAAFPNRKAVTRLAILMFNDEGVDGSVRIDNIRFHPYRPDIQTNPYPSIGLVSPDTTAARTGHAHAWTLSLTAGYTNPFDRNDIALTGRFAGPDGRTIDAPGFLLDRTDEADRAQDRWQVRFRPPTPGTWTVEFALKTKRGLTVSAAERFEVQADIDKTVQRSSSDPRFLEHADGTPYVPIGLNVAWAGDFDHFFKRMADAGHNATRVWLCPWGLDLEPADHLQQFDTAVAARMDALFESAQRHNIRVILVLENHAALSWNWSSSPYSSANDGPVKTPQEFFRNPRARKLYRRKLDYAMARWGASPALLAWELLNEADLAKHERVSDVVAWHQHMARHLRASDPYRRLITTSALGRKGFDALFDIPEIDLVQGHVYSPDAVGAVLGQYDAHQHHHKPYLLAEFGRGWLPENDQADPEGKTLHAGLWAQALTPSAGGALTWWWDTHVEANDLYGLWTAPAAFLGSVDRRHRHFQSMHTRVSEDLGIHALGLIDPYAAYLWIHRPQDWIEVDRPHQPMITTDALSISLHGLMDGTWSVHAIDAWTGNPLGETGEATVDGGRIELALPPSNRDYLLRFEIDQRTLPGTPDAALERNATDRRLP